MAKARSLIIEGLQAAIVGIKKPKGILWDDKSSFPKKDGSLRLAFKRGSLYECRSLTTAMALDTEGGPFAPQPNAHR